MRRKPFYGTPEERFWHYTIKSEDPDGHWIWTGTVNEKGYGRMGAGDRGVISPHIFSWELANGMKVPEGLEIDHKCRVRLCVNPKHLQAITHPDNIKRGYTPELVEERRAAKTHCKFDHPLTEDNIYRYKNIETCRTCRRNNVIRYRSRRSNA